jgi:hypothetical protein
VEGTNYHRHLRRAQLKESYDGIRLLRYHTLTPSPIDPLCRAAHLDHLILIVYFSKSGATSALTCTYSLRMVDEPQGPLFTADVNPSLLKLEEIRLGSTAWILVDKPLGFSSTYTP